MNILYIGNDLSGSTKYSTTMETLYALLKKEGCNVYKSSSKQNRFLRMIDMFFAVCKKHKSLDYILIDTYSTFNYYYALIISQLARVFKIKYIPMLHGGNLPSRLEKCPRFSKLIFDNSYKNVAPSNYLRSAFENAGFETVFIPNVLEIEKYNFKERKKIQPRLLWVRAFKELYNPTMAVNVLRQLHKLYPNAKLCMIGPVHDESLIEVQKLSDTYGLNESIEFIEGLSKEEWHKKSEDFDVFINTTNFDNTPISVMEAMALGLPVVSTDVGGLSFLIEDSKDGVLVAKNDYKQMNAQIIQLIEGKYDCESIINSARKKVEGFGWSVVKSQWFEILK